MASPLDTLKKGLGALNPFGGNASGNSKPQDMAPVAAEAKRRAKKQVEGDTNGKPKVNP